MMDSKKNNQITCYLFSLALTSASALLYYFMYRLPLLGIDDANIYFTYMRNFANGFGFVYNVGGERVEGFTSIFYTLIGSAIFLFTEKIETVLFIINILAVSYIIYKVSIFIDNLINREHNLYAIVLVLSILLLLMPGYFFWTTLSLMESGIWSLFLCLIILAIFDKNTISNRLKFMILIALLIVTRPEAYFWAFYMVLLRGLYEYTYHKHLLSRVLKENWLFLFTSLFVLAALLIWRYNYFGYLLPNTFYVKVYGSFWYNFKLGLEYLISFLIYTNPLILMTLVSIVYLTKIKLKEITYSEAVQLILAMVILVALAIPVVLGGDYFKWNRFYIVFLPVMYIPLFNLPFLEKYVLKFRIFRESLAIGKYLIYAVLAIFIVLLPRESLDQLVRGENLANSNYINKSGQELAIFLNDFFADSELPHVSVIAAGMAYRYEGKTFDLLGLNNTKMAHSNLKIKGFKNHDGFNKQVFFEVRPDFIYEALPAKIVISDDKITVDIYSDEFKSRFINRGLDEIWFDPRFQQIYKPVIISKNNADKRVFTWANIEYLQNLDSTKYFIKYLPY